MKMPTNEMYKAYLKGFITKAQYDAYTKETTRWLAGVGLITTVSYLINPVLGIVVGTGSLLAGAFEDYVLAPKRLKKSTDIVIDDVIEVRPQWVALKGDRDVEITPEQYEIFCILKQEFPNLDYEVEDYNSR